MVKYRCPKCKTAMQSPEQMVGKYEKCPNCGDWVKVPNVKSSEWCDVKISFKEVARLFDRFVKEITWYLAVFCFIIVILALFPRAHYNWRAMTDPEGLRRDIDKVVQKEMREFEKAWLREAKRLDAYFREIEKASYEEDE